MKSFIQRQLCNKSNFTGLPHYLCGSSSSLHEIYDSLATRGPTADVSLEQPSPQYILAHSGNVTAILGKGAILNCRVQGVANRTVRTARLQSLRYWICTKKCHTIRLRKYDISTFQVSWIRHKTTHLLAAGRYWQNIKECCRSNFEHFF